MYPSRFLSIGFRIRGYGFVEGLGLLGKPKLLCLFRFQSMLSLTTCSFMTAVTEQINSLTSQILNQWWTQNSSICPSKPLVRYFVIAACFMLMVPARASTFKGDEKIKIWYVVEGLWFQFRLYVLCLTNRIDSKKRAKVNVKARCQSVLFILVKPELNSRLEGKHWTQVVRLA